VARPAPDGFTFVPTRVGVGIGSKDTPEGPNLLRAVLGESAAPGATETIECAEANLDDSNPEWIGYLMERLLAAGALDVALIPIHMKKNRPGTQIQVLYPPALRGSVQGLLFSETTTLGVRYRTLQRVALQRERVVVTTPWGEVGGVEARHGEHMHFSPEFEACRRVAEAAGVPLREGLAKGEVSIRTDLPDLRKAPRFRTPGSNISVRVEPQFSLLDISASGFAFLSELPFAQDDVLHVILRSALAFQARVVGCQIVETDRTLLETRYRVQCRFDDDISGKHLLVLMREIERLMGPVHAD